MVAMIGFVLYVIWCRVVFAVPPARSRDSKADMTGTFFKWPKKDAMRNPKECGPAVASTDVARDVRTGCKKPPDSRGDGVRFYVNLNSSLAKVLVAVRLHRTVQHLLHLGTPFSLSPRAVVADPGVSGAEESELQSCRAKKEEGKSKFLIQVT